MSIPLVYEIVIILIVSEDKLKLKMKFEGMKSFQGVYTVRSDIKFHSKN